MERLRSFVFAWVVITNLFLCWQATGQNDVPVAEALSKGTASLAVEVSPTYRVLLLGNIGNGPSEQPSLVQEMLAAHLATVDSNSAVVFLGDNTPCCSFPDSANAAESEVADGLSSWLNALQGYAGEVVFLPGNTESGSTTEGRQTLQHKAYFIDRALERRDVFRLAEGYPGPEVIKLTDGLTMIALNTQWWLDSRQRYGDTGEYDLNEPLDFLTELEEVLYKHRNDQLIMVGHHPLFSNGNYGGKFSLWQHLTPLPALGSAMPLYRQLVGNRQDLASSRYRVFRQEMLQLLRIQHNLIYAAAHDHSLQYFAKDDRRRVKHHITSGSANYDDHVSKGRGASFVSRAHGFMEVEFYEDGSAWLNAWTIDADSPKGKRAYRTQLVLPNELQAARTEDERLVVPPVEESPVVMPINATYAQAGGIGRFFLGRQYRELWATPVQAPVLDWTNEADGLTPIKIGGQSQSVTLRVSGGDGKYYMLRSIDKRPTRSLSSAARRTFAGTIIQDQVAMQHPFGAFLVPHLAGPAGIFHTNPRLMYVPPDPRGEVQNEALVGQVVLFEERADEDVSDIDSFGNASNVIGSAKLFNEIDDDNDHRVDPYMFARARLFDMLIADHDRTLDNFRWGAFEPFELNPDLEGEARKEGKIYLPIPVDRDKAFSKNDGVFPTLYRVLAEPAWQSFGEAYGYLRGLNRKGMPLDRRFSGVLDRTAWVGIADSMRLALSDDVIEQAVRTWPEPVFEEGGDEMIRTLKARRDQLSTVADQYYDVLASVIDVVGSNKHEVFRINRIDDETTEVVMYKANKKGEIRKELFRRTVKSHETHEIRLYGQGGNDRFETQGEVDRGPRIIIVGGPDDDTIVDASIIRKGPRKTHVFDTVRGTTIAEGPETKQKLSAAIDVNTYEFESFKPNLTRPVTYFGSNRDDGFFIGGGFKRSVHGFRKTPHAATHQLMGNYAAATRAFNLQYIGHYVDVFGPWDFRLDAAFFNPNNIRNFYGLGNETPNDATFSRFYQARFSRLLVNPTLQRSFEQGVAISFGPSFEITDPRFDEGRFIGQPQPGISRGSFDQLVFAGVNANLDVGTVDNALNPLQGFRFSSSVDLNAGVIETNDTYATIASALSIYMSPSLSPQVTLALRAGGAHNIGEFPFFASNTLGGNANLRGYRSTRFAGRSSLYQNIEARVELIDFSGYFGYGTLGLTGFLDNGRVWTDGESSRTWHQGYGGGLWISVFDQLFLNGQIGFSDEETNYAVGLGFMF